MSDNRPAEADGCSLCKCPAGGVLPPAGRFRLWGDALSLARTWLHASPSSLYSVLRFCVGAGGMWERSRRESAGEARLDAVLGALRVRWRSRVAFVSAGG